MLVCCGKRFRLPAEVVFSQVPPNSPAPLNYTQKFMRKILLCPFPALFCGAFLVRPQDETFLEKPYLQLGDRPKESHTEALSLL